VGEGLGLDPLVEGVQVGRLAGGDGEDDLRVVDVADDPAADGLDAVVGTDFPGQGVGQCGRKQDRGSLVGGDGDGNVVGPVGGDKQGRDPQQRGQDDDQAEAGGGVPHPPVEADVSAYTVVEQGAVRERLPEPADRGGHPGSPGGEDQQAEHDQGDAVGAIGVHQLLRVLTRTVRLGG
jgi:hypothetical protein